MRTRMAELIQLRKNLKCLYEQNKGKLLFHGWHHIMFVTKKAVQFAKTINADVFLVETAALVHDLNYIVKDFSEPDAGQSLREKILQDSGYSKSQAHMVERIIEEAHNKQQNISPEAKALSDGDTLFKALPILPVLFAYKYLEQNKIDIGTLAKKIIEDQKSLFDEGVYFYTETAKKYLPWAEVNLRLWENIDASLQDKDVLQMLYLAEK